MDINIFLAQRKQSCRRDTNEQLMIAFCCHGERKPLKYKVNGIGILYGVIVKNIINTPKNFLKN